MQNPEISGIEYQQGILQGYEVKEYLLEKFKRTCVYCGATDVPLEVEHVIPRSRRGSDRISNLVLACNPCNRAKGNLTAEEFGYPEIQKQAKTSLRPAAYMNSAKSRLLREMQNLGLPILPSFGYQTKENRIKQKYPKEHWVDAACIGEDGSNVRIKTSFEYFAVKCFGHGSRRMQNMDCFGFPVGKPKRMKLPSCFGFQTGDYVRVVFVRGRRKGRYTGRISCRESGYFDLATQSGVLRSVSYKNVKRFHQRDGYSYRRCVLN
jgi:hypothetical protein